MIHCLGDEAERVAKNIVGVGLKLNDEELVGVYLREKVRRD